MSNFTNYDDVSKGYDIYRRVTNLDLVIAMSTHLTGKPVKEMSILDAGCGTGNYSLGLLDAGLGRITMMDGSNGMLNTARTKTDHYKDIAEYRLGKLPKLSFPDESFDVVMFNQVLHHLEPTKVDSRYPVARDTLKEAIRVLKKGGVIVIDTCSHEQVKRGMWFYPLLGITEQYKTRYPPVSLLCEALRDGGCSSVQTFVQTERVLMDYDMYCNVEGALDASWRRVDSGFSLATPQQIEEFCQKINDMKSKNSLKAFFDETEQGRRSFGQATTIFARK